MSNNKDQDIILSICIPTHNREALLRENLKQIRSKISDYQNELLIMQMDSKWASNLISGLEVTLNNYNYCSY